MTSAPLSSTAVLLVAGWACGFLNAAASSGSAITLPLLLSLGLPPAVANGTNRLPVLAGFITALWRFDRAAAIPWRLTLQLLPIFLGGAVLGAALAVTLHMTVIHRVIQVALLLALGMVLIKPHRWLKDKASVDASQPPSAQLQVLMALVGFWAGLIVLDTATYLLVSLVLVGGLALPQANAIKGVLVGAASLASLLVFGRAHALDWQTAMPLMLGSAVGGWFGAGVALGPNARQWIYRLLILALSLEVLAMIAGR